MASELPPHMTLDVQSPARLRPTPRANGRQTGVTYLGPGGWPDLEQAAPQPHDAGGERSAVRDAETRAALASGVSPVRGYVNPAPPGVTVSLPAIAQPIDPGSSPGKSPRGVRGVRPPQITPAPMTRTWER